MKQRCQRVMELVAVSSCLLILVLAGCSIDPGKKLTKAMKSWMGQPCALLVGAWGPPQQVFDDGRGGRVLMYTEYRLIGASRPSSTTQSTYSATAIDNMIWGTGTSRTTYDPGRVIGYTAWRMFYVDQEGTVYSFAWKGL